MTSVLNHFRDAPSAQDVEPMPNLRTGRSRSVDHGPPDDAERQRRVSQLLDELLLQIYGHSYRRQLSTASSCLESEGAYLPMPWHDARVHRKSVRELRQLVRVLQTHVTQLGALLVRQLKRRDVLLSRRERHCDVVTALLQAVSPKRCQDTRIRFSVMPIPGDSGFSQWHDAMKMVARLPGGIPQDFRRRLWLTLAEKHLQARGVDWNRTQRVCFNEWSNPDDEELGVQIVKDLHRTGCSLFCGAEAEQNQALLKRVLLAYARWNKAVGYCQGFNMLAALILQVMDRSEVDSVKVMIYLIEGVLPESYFANNLRGLSVDMAVFRDLLRLRLPTLSRHLEQLQHEAGDSTGTSYEPPLTNVFTMQWFLTLFSNCLPQSAVLRVWDLIFLEGNEVLLRTALAIWDSLADRIMAVDSADEFYSIMGVLTREMLEFGLMDTNNLIKTIVNLAPFPFPELPELRDKYLYNITPWTHTVSTAARRGLRLFYSDDDDETDEEDEKIAVAATYGISTVFRSPRRKDSLGHAHSISLPSVPDRERIALDISALKQQYAKLRERQRQAHIILTACARQPLGPSAPNPVAMNHLLLGKSALRSVRGRKVGPPTGAIPPPANLKVPSRSNAPRQPVVTSQGQLITPASEIVAPQKDFEMADANKSGETLLWKDANAKKSQSLDSDEDAVEVDEFTEKVTNSSSSSSTELCDEPDRLSDFDSEEPTSISDSSSYTTSGNLPDVKSPSELKTNSRSRSSSVHADVKISSDDNLINFNEVTSQEINSAAVDEKNNDPVSERLDIINDPDILNEEVKSNVTIIINEPSENLLIHSNLSNKSDVPSSVVHVHEEVGFSDFEPQEVTIHTNNSPSTTQQFKAGDELNLNLELFKNGDGKNLSETEILSQPISPISPGFNEQDVLSTALKGVSPVSEENTLVDITVTSEAVPTKLLENIYSTPISTDSIVEEKSLESKTLDESPKDLKPCIGVSETSDMSELLQFNHRLHTLEKRSEEILKASDSQEAKIIDATEMTEILEIDEKINLGRRNSERALQIIQENSEILQRILLCQDRRPSKLSEEGSNGTNIHSDEDSQTSSISNIPTPCTEDKALKLSLEEISPYSVGGALESKDNISITDDQSFLLEENDIKIASTFDKWQNLSDEQKLLGDTSKIPEDEKKLSIKSQDDIEEKLSKLQIHSDNTSYSANEYTSLKFRNPFVLPDLSPEDLLISHRKQNLLNTHTLEDFDKTQQINENFATFNTDTTKDMSLQSNKLESNVNLPASTDSDSVITQNTVSKIIDQDRKHDGYKHISEINTSEKFHLRETPYLPSNLKAKHHYVPASLGLFHSSEIDYDLESYSEKTGSMITPTEQRSDNSHFSKKEVPESISSSFAKVGLMEKLVLDSRREDIDIFKKETTEIKRNRFSDNLDEFSLHPSTKLVSDFDNLWDDKTMAHTDRSEFITNHKSDIKLPSKLDAKFDISSDLKEMEDKIKAIRKEISDPIRSKYYSVDVMPEEKFEKPAMHFLTSEDKVRKSDIKFKMSDDSDKKTDELSETEDIFNQSEDIFQFNSSLLSSFSSSDILEYPEPIFQREKIQLNEPINSNEFENKLFPSISILKDKHCDTIEKTTVSPPPFSENLSRSSSSSSLTGSFGRPRHKISPPPSPFHRYTSPPRQERPRSLLFYDHDDSLFQDKKSPLFKSVSLLSVRESQVETSSKKVKKKDKSPMRRRTSTDLPYNSSFMSNKPSKGVTPSPTKSKDICASLPPIKSVHTSPTHTAKYSPFPARSTTWQPKELGIKLGLYSPSEKFKSETKKT